MVEVKTIVTTPWKDPAILEVGPVHWAFTQEENEVMKLLKKGSEASWKCHPARDGRTESQLREARLSQVIDLVAEEPGYWSNLIRYISYVDDVLIYDEEYIPCEQKYYYTCGLKRHTVKEHEVVAIEALKEL